ncbi:ATPase related to phosphate starvation-inducible protein PhoH [Corynebacterium glutamicum MT]|uniref:ATP-binding protein n=1 Tax=Corynebacterium glutamicum TaxID=1718 RepID=A0AB36ID18_CORGT|nr:PhoH family protein [Corynebacterium glutamicum]AGN17673.1 ATPase related to phosphate starvation-inducible protein PhoH [Corynebacterium glutamicum SCgG1]AGN20696.1 ATPase related to phosphate starvation-inducible protein PhoH [Corynebacterium glutamicum SCgG2]EGV41285.1 ATPase related to phosphate starvation-inducible protein PhoH [Corynebacterium glutamicum S9114]EOA63868.1 ATPase related to phosphate starvation-inducible protein PhoH [Corynebacterium glutamicum MT]EPP39412.1 ATPase rela
MTTTYPDFLGNSSLQTDTEHWEMEGGAQEVSVTYVLDTSVLLSDPLSLTRFAEHDVVLPIVVITELEAKRHHPDLGFFARQALRMLDELREIHGDLSKPLPIGDEGGHIHVELNHQNTESLPVGFRLGDNDTRILAVAKNLQEEGHNVVLVSKDLPMRIKASASGIAAQEYRAALARDRGYTGMTHANITDDQLSELYDTGEVRIEELEKLPVNHGFTLKSPSGSALGRMNSDKIIEIVPGDQQVFGISGRSAEQRVAIDLLNDDAVGIVSIGGPAGTGKSALALCAGLEAVMERRIQRKIIVFRPLFAVGGQELGYLPGDQEEKMGPWAQAVFDTLSSMVSQNIIDEALSRGLIEVLPLTHIRGRSLHDAFVIVDEAQSLERNVLLTMLSRIGQNSRVVLTHDVAQRDNLRVGRYDGIVSVVEALKDHELFGHITLQRSERSRIAELVTQVLDAPSL